MIDPVREDGVLGNTWEGNEEMRLGRVCVVGFVVVCMVGCAEGAPCARPARGRWGRDEGEPGVSIHGKPDTALPLVKCGDSCCPAE